MRTWRGRVGLTNAVLVLLLAGAASILVAGRDGRPSVSAPTPSPDRSAQPDVSEPHVSVSPTGDTSGSRAELATPAANTRLGLHVTADELAIWRARAARGPYRSPGDVESNTPGDWDRISDNAANFVNDPGAGRWDGPVRNNPDGCVRRDGGNHSGQLKWQPPVQPAAELRDAAFHALVLEQPGQARLVAQELLAQAQEPGVDFADDSRWCVGQILDGSPGFMVASWLTKLLFAYDYIEVLDPAIIAPEDDRLLLDWFSAAAEWMRYDTDLKLDELFVDRSGGEYTLTSMATDRTSGDRVLYAGGPEARTLHRRFNNRNARQARYVTLVGIKARNADFVEHGVRYVKDALRYAYFPDGAVADFERWTSGDPIKGWRYGVQFAGALITIADHLQRAGMENLYEFSTTDGALGTEGSHHSGEPKSLKTLVTDMLRYVDGTYERYASEATADVGRPNLRIDSEDSRSDDERVTDTALVMANRYYEDPYIRSVYTRTAEGAPTYPPEPASGVGDPHSGEHGVYPGMLFMFGQTEERVRDIAR